MPSPNERQAHVSVNDTTTAPHTGGGTSRKVSVALVALIAVGALVLALVISGIAFFVAVNNAQREGTKLESRLSAEYPIAQGQLSTLIGTVKDSLGVANMKAEKMDDIIAGAMKGRYDTGETGSGVADAQLVINAVHEAYPDLAQLDSYDEVIRAITTGRQTYQNEQGKLMDMLGAFTEFRNGGIIHKQIVSIAGIPDDSLRAAIGGDVVYGEAALNRMWQVVLEDGTVEAYQTGVMPDLIPDSDDK